MGHDVQLRIGLCSCLCKPTNQISLEKLRENKWSWCPGPRLAMSSSDLQSHSVQCVCGAEDAEEGQRSRDPAGFLGMMALLEQKDLGFCWRLLLTFLTCACAGTCSTAQGVTKKVRMERAEERVPAISICLELWLCLFPSLQRLFTLLRHLKKDQAG